MIDGNFLDADVHKDPGRCRIDIVYVESAAKRTTLVSENYPSPEHVSEAIRSGVLLSLADRARELCPAIGLREQTNLALMKDLLFEPRDVACLSCGTPPGKPCGCDDRTEELQQFLIWLAEQRHIETDPLTKKRIIDVAERLGYCTATNLSYRGPEVIVTQWSTGDRWGLYVGGRVDPTKSVWMTRGVDLSDPERGPFRNEREIALALRSLGRE